MLGPVSAILVGGDIAFCGAEQEYVAALAWLTELADATGCAMERVYVVPGNHDVDRRIVSTTPTIQNAHAAVLAAAPNSRERMLRKQLNDPDTGRALLAPLAAYNDFAKQFDCQIYLPERPYWKQDLALENGVTLRVHGLTSTFLSGVDGRDDEPKGLYLSPLQTVLDPADDVVNLVICHHPPDWFMDHDDIDDAICGRAAIHLFGHKHRQRHTKDDRYIRFSAAAVNPDRSELGWKPGYNLIEINVDGDGKERALVIGAHLLDWQDQPERFRAVLTPNDEAVFRHIIAIPGNAKKSTIPSVDCESVVVAIVPILPELVRASVEGKMNDESTRHIVFRFWQLKMNERREIALALNLITDAELRLPEAERYGRAFARAKERGLVDRLAREISQREAE